MYSHLLFIIPENYTCLSYFLCFNCLQLYFGNLPSGLRFHRNSTFKTLCKSSFILFHALPISKHCNLLHDNKNKQTLYCGNVFNSRHFQFVLSTARLYAGVFNIPVCSEVRLNPIICLVLFFCLFLYVLNLDKLRESALTVNINLTIDKIDVMYIMFICYFCLREPIWKKNEYVLEIKK